MDEAAPREQPIPDPARPVFIRRALKLALLAAVLVVHFLSRQYLVPTRPMREGWNYPYVYRTSLAILAGRGFGVFRFSDAPESKPVVAFLDGQRDGLSREELRRFRDGPDGRPVAFPLPEAQTALPHYPPGGELATPLSPLHSSRVLDLYLTALLWKIFGVRWSVLLTACALVSTAVCLLVFLTARRLGGGFWPGLCAAVLYLASPLENDFAVRALRDISPLWFAALAFACLVCLVERFRSTAANTAALGLTGFACTLGCGWRPDAMLLVPFIAASAAVVVLRRRRGWRYLLAAAGAFLVGAVVPLAAIRVLAPASSQSPLVGFQMGYYGEYARCNLLGLENSFQASRDDVDTAEAAQQWHADHHPHAGPAPCYGPAYGAACLGMYREEVLPNLFRWTWSFPRFYTRALDACRNRDLPINGSAYLPPLPRPKWLQPAAVWLLEPLSAAGPWLFALGAAVCLLRRGERGRSLCLAVFSVYYAAALFFVLPELKHAGPLVLPLTVFGGVGLASCLGVPRLLQPCLDFATCRGVPRLLQPCLDFATCRGVPRPSRPCLDFAPSARPRRPWHTLLGALRPALWLAGGAVVATLAWGLACAAAYGFSLESRRELLDAVTALARTGRPDPAALHGPRLFSVTLLPERGDRPTGYLLRIAAGAGPCSLECRRLRPERPLAPARLFFTRHRLHPGREQCFFVTCNPGAEFGDVNPLVCTAFLEGKARFLSCTRVDLTDWRRLPVCTVFVPGECEPGDPVVGGTTGVTQYAANPDLNEAGLSLDEVLRCGAAPPAELFPHPNPPPPAGGGQGGGDGGRRADLPPQGWRPVSADCPTERTADGLRVRTPPQPGAYAAETPTLTAPADGTYYFRLRYRPEVGRLTFGALSADRQSWLAIHWCDDPAGADAERVLAVKLRAGQVFSLIASNGALQAGEGSVFVLEGLSACRDGSGD